MGRNDILTPWAVEALIADGHTIVISEGRVLRLDCWLAKHPGGSKAIEHMVGREATNEINMAIRAEGPDAEYLSALNYPLLGLRLPMTFSYHAATTLKLMDAYRIGYILEPWINLTPPIRGGVYTKNTLDLEEYASSSVDTDQASDEDCFSVDSNAVSLESSASSIGSYEIPKIESDPVPDVEAEGLRRRRETEHKEAPILSRLSPDAYIAHAIRGEIEDGIRENPSLDQETQRGINLKYKKLHQRVHDEGFYQCRYIEYAKEVTRYTLIFTAFIVALRTGWYMTSACLLGLFWHQIMFTAHDAGHRGITHNFVADTLMGMFIADFCCGLSIGWWKSSHNVHHLITNSPEHDPDIQNIPLFSTCPTFMKSIHSTYYDFTYVWDAAANIAVKYQKYTYYPVMGVARFNLYILSIHHLLMSKNMSPVAWTRPTELGFMACYWFLFGYCLVWRSIPTWTLRIAFVLVSHIITMPLHVQITLSHWGMPTADLGEGESFPQRQLRTTMDVDCPAWLDFIHGGLQFQAVHHLFPRVPRHNLRRLQVLVREFCADTGIEYKCLGFVEGNKEVLGRLGDIGRQAEMLVKCQQYMAETGESGLH